MTPFALLLDRCGLSHLEAAAFLDTRKDTVSSWASGRRNPPQGVIDQLRGLYAAIDNSAEQALEQIADLIEETEAVPAEIELGYCADNHEAQSLGFPCVGAHAAMLGIVVALSPVPVKLVPRGSTSATAAPIEAHEKAPPLR